MLTYAVITGASTPKPLFPAFKNAVAVPPRLPAESMTVAQYAGSAMPIDPSDRESQAEIHAGFLAVSATNRNRVAALNPTLPNRTRLRRRPTRGNSKSDTN